MQGYVINLTNRDSKIKKKQLYQIIVMAYGLKKRQVNFYGYINLTG